MVYVLDIDGNPIMPTRRHGHARRLLRERKAHVVKRCPFTIQLDYETTGHTQEVSLVDGTVVFSDVSCKRLNLLERRKTILVERRSAAPPHA